MKTIHFTAIGQELTVNKEDIKDIVKGTKNFFLMAFKYDTDWYGCRLVAQFDPIVVDPEFIPIKNGICRVPDSVSKLDKYMVKLIGEKSDGYRITTNNVYIYQGD